MDAWLPAERMLAAGSPDLDDWMKSIGGALGTDRVPVCASLLLERYARALGLAAFGGVARTGRVPDLAAGNVALRVDGDGVVCGLVLHRARSTGSRGGEEALLVRCSSRLVDRHLAALVARLGERPVRRGPRALWGLVANGCAAAVVETVGDEPARASRWVEAFFGWPGCPMPAPRLLAVPGNGRVRLVRKRVTCCLSYKLDDACATCPLRSDGETVRRTAATVAAGEGDRSGAGLECRPGGLGPGTRHGATA